MALDVINRFSVHGFTLPDVDLQLWFVEVLSITCYPLKCCTASKLNELHVN